MARRRVYCTLQEVDRLPHCIKYCQVQGGMYGVGYCQVLDILYSVGYCQAQGVLHSVGY
jgi:hypothetical protein